MTRIRRRSVLQAALAGTGFAVLGAPAADARTGGPPPRDLSAETPLVVGTYNIRYASYDTDPAFPERMWSNRGIHAARSIARAGAVLVALQEVSYLNTADSQARSLAALLSDETGHAWQALEASRMQAFVYDSTAVESLGPVSLRDLLVEHARPDPPQRVVGWAPFRHLPSGLELTMVNSHLPIQDDSPPWGREMTWEAVATLVDQLQILHASTGNPVVLGADFNDAQTGPYLLGQAGYADPARLVPAPAHPRFNAFNNWDPLLVGRQRGIWIDRIAVSSELTAVRAGLEVDFADGAGLPLRVPIGSDHFLMFAELVAAPAVSTGPGTTLPLTVPLSIG